MTIFFYNKRHRLIIDIADHWATTNLVNRLLYCLIDYCKVMQYFSYVHDEVKAYKHYYCKVMQYFSYVHDEIKAYKH